MHQLLVRLSIWQAVDYRRILKVKRLSVVFRVLGLELFALSCCHNFLLGVRKEHHVDGN